MVANSSKDISIKVDEEIIECERSILTVQTEANITYRAQKVSQMN